MFFLLLTPKLLQVCLPGDTIQSRFIGYLLGCGAQNIVSDGIWSVSRSPLEVKTLLLSQTLSIEQKSDTVFPVVKMRWGVGTGQSGACAFVSVHLCVRRRIWEEGKLVLFPSERWLWLKMSMWTDHSFIILPSNNQISSFLFTNSNSSKPHPQTSKFSAIQALIRLKIPS